MERMARASPTELPVVSMQPPAAGRPARGWAPAQCRAAKQGSPRTRSAPESAPARRAAPCASIDAAAPQVGTAVWRAARRRGADRAVRGPARACRRRGRARSLERPAPRRVRAARRRRRSPPGKTCEPPPRTARRRRRYRPGTPSGSPALAPARARRASPRASRPQRLRLVHEHDGGVVLDPVHQAARLANDLLLLLVELELALALRAGEDLLELRRDGHRGLDITKNATAPRGGSNAGNPRTPVPKPSPRPPRRPGSRGAARIPARSATAAAPLPPTPWRGPPPAS